MFSEGALVRLLDYITGNVGSRDSAVAPLDDIVGGAVRALAVRHTEGCWKSCGI